MAAQALAGQDTDFNLGHVEPGSVERCKVKTHMAHKAIGFQDTEGLDQHRLFWSHLVYDYAQMKQTTFIRRLA